VAVDGGRKEDDARRATRNERSRTSEREASVAGGRETPEAGGAAGGAAGAGGRRGGGKRRCRGAEVSELGRAVARDVVGRRGASRVAKGKVGPEGGGLGERRREANGGKPGKGRAPEEAAPSLERDESEQRNAVCRRRHHRRRHRRHHRRDRCRHRREDNVGGTNGHARVCRDTTATFWPPPETKWLPRLLTSPRDGDKTFSLLASFSSPKLRINGQTPSNRVFLSPKVLTSRATFSPTRRPPASPSPTTSDAILLLDDALRLVQRRTEFPRLSAASDRNLGNCALLLKETFFAAWRDRSGEPRRNGVRSTANRVSTSKWTGPIRESGRILSVLPITRSMRETPVQLLCRTVGEHASDR
jgi:hypothetical protein